MERLRDVLVGASIAGWGVTAFFADDPRPLAVRLTVLVLNGTVAALFVLRSAERRGARWREVLVCMPSLFAGAFAAHLSPPHWPVATQLLFVVAGALTTLSLVTLGRSFAILPAVRRVVTGGPYRYVRHPAYLAELFLVAAAGFSRGPGWGAGLTLAALLSVAVRIGAEEKTLRSERAWCDYADRVRYRLVPRVW